MIVLSESTSAKRLGEYFSIRTELVLREGEATPVETFVVRTSPSLYERGHRSTSENPGGYITKLEDRSGRILVDTNVSIEKNQRQVHSSALETHFNFIKLLRIGGEVNVRIGYS